MHAPHNTLDRLNLHANKRKAAEAYHLKVVTEYMKTVPKAHSATIINLAHTKGSRDPKLHISARIFDEHGKEIGKIRPGTEDLRDASGKKIPPTVDPTHHIYVNHKDLAPEYSKACDKKGGC